MQVDDATKRFRERHTSGDAGGGDESQVTAAAQAAYAQERPGPSWPTIAWSPAARRVFADNEIGYIVFDPLSTTDKTARINPLDAIRVGTPYEVGDAERLAEALLGIDRHSSRTMTESHFAAHGARTLGAHTARAVYA